MERDNLIELLERALQEEKPKPAPQPEKRGVDPLAAVAIGGIVVILLAVFSYPSTVGSGVPAQGGDSSVTAK